MLAQMLPSVRLGYDLGTLYARFTHVLRTIYARFTHDLRTFYVQHLHSFLWPLAVAVIRYSCPRYVDMMILYVRVHVRVYACTRVRVRA